MMSKTLLSILLLSVLMLVGCSSDFQPKPKGYHRINPLIKNLTNLNIGCPYSFEYPDYLKIELGNKEKCSINLHSAYYNSTLHLTYKPIENNFEHLLYDFHKLTYEHTSKADGIDEKLIELPDSKVYSIFYELHGPAASSLQFLATDSFNHILRGSLYFNNIPNVDSIKPVHNIYKDDILHLINTIDWQNN